MIIDAKAYKNGFALPINEQDKMVRYIEEYKNTTGIWIDNIIDEEMYNTIDNLVYQFISSSFNNIEGKLTSIKNRTSIDD